MKIRLTQKKEINFHNDFKFKCVDCGDEIELPPNRIMCHSGWKWVCNDCVGLNEEVGQNE